MIYLILGMRQEIERPIPIIRTNSGQAAVEYILIVVIIVILFVGLSVQFFQPLQTFVDASVGKYVECLLETGELPALGGESRIADDAGCSAKLNAKAFKAATSYAGGGSTGGSSGSGSQSGKSSDEKERSNGGGATYAGSSGRSGLFGNRKNGSLESTSENPKIVEISLAASPEAGLSKARQGVFSSSSGRVNKPVISYGLSSGEKEKVEKETKAASRVIASDLRGQSPKKIALKPQVKSEKKDIEEASIGFGDYLRYFLIGAIIIVLALLIGGQAARLAKGWEK